MSNNSLTEKTEWWALEAHHKTLTHVKIADLFAQNHDRFSKFSRSLDGILLDYSKTCITDETLSLLIDLAQSCALEDWRDKMFSGAALNNSENRAVLHPALRGSARDDLEVDGENVNAFVAGTLSQIKALSEKMCRNKTFTDIVNIGVGGSDIGPHMVCKALLDSADGPRMHFVSNIDGTHLQQTLDQLDPQSTLFIISSKTFTTLETMVNAQSAKNWLGELPLSEHLIAVTENEHGAEKFGVSSEHIIPMRNWIGGRFSLWSGIGFSIALSIGYDGFEQLLAGAHAIDRHFQTAPLAKNIPVLMALIGIWHRNFCGYDAHAIIPYAQNLDLFPSFVQQLEMESNGKSVDRDGKYIDYQTSPIIFGGTGTDSQHAFFQMFHQGTTIIPCDLIVPVHANHDLHAHHAHIIANAVAQSEALMRGRQDENAPHKNFEGNRPSNMIVLSNLDPYHLGMLIALYEHKIFVEGIIWNINSYDQWGVELGKNIAQNISQVIENERNIKKESASVEGVLSYIMSMRP